MAEVTALKGVVSSTRKQQFLDTLAQKFDDFVHDSGSEPDGMAFGFANRDATMVFWHVDEHAAPPSWIIARIGAGLLQSAHD